MTEKLNIYRKQVTVSAARMNEKRHFHHFLNMSRNIHDTIIATNVNSVEIAQCVEAQDVDNNIKGVNIAAAKRVGNIHQNLMMKFFMA